MGAVVSGLEGEPCDFIVAPNPEKVALLIGLAGMFADAVVIEFNDVREVVAVPAAEGGSAFAAIVNAIAEAELEDGFLRFVRSFLYAKGEGVEIENWIAVVHEAAAGDVPIAKDHVAPGVFGGVIANAGDESEPMGVSRIIAVHDFDLAEVDRLATEVDVGSGLVIKPQLGFEARNVRYLAVTDRAALAGWVDDILVTEVALFNRLAEVAEDPIGNGDFIYFGDDDFEDAGLKHNVGIGGEDFRDVFTRALDIGKEIVFGTPEAKGAADVFGAAIGDHSSGVGEISPAV